MGFGIIKTIPARDGQAHIESLYDGSRTTFEFHMSGKPSKVKAGNYAYTIFNDQLVGRLQITALTGGAVNPKSGRPRTLIMVACFGERLSELIPHKGHLGTSYYDGADWP